VAASLVVSRVPLPLGGQAGIAAEGLISSEVVRLAWSGSNGAFDRLQLLVSSGKLRELTNVRRRRSAPCSGSRANPCSVLLWWVRMPDCVIGRFLELGGPNLRRTAASSQRSLGSAPWSQR
jgi:hypothetical protein